VSKRSSLYIGFGGVVMVLLAVPAARAQRDTAAASPTATGTRGLCWRPRPAPRCRAYLVTEVGYEHAVITSRVGGFEPNPDFSGRFVWSLGAMANRGANAALGGLLSASAGDEPEGSGLLRAEGRYRKWIGPTRGIDFSVGITQKLVRTPFREPVRAQGLTAAVGVDQGLVGADVRVDALYGGARPRGAALVGIRFGSYAAPVAILAQAVAAFVALARMGD
jgi:hypothetical protein